jgi:hypothetical protein
MAHVRSTALIPVQQCSSPVAATVPTDRRWLVKSWLCSNFHSGSVNFSLNVDRGSGYVTIARLVLAASTTGLLSPGMVLSAGDKLQVTVSAGTNVYTHAAGIEFDVAT